MQTTEVQHLPSNHVDCLTCSCLLFIRCCRKSTLSRRRRFSMDSEWYSSLSCSCSDSSSWCTHTHTHHHTHTHACMRTHTHTQMTDCDLDGWQYEDSVLFMIQLLGLVPWTQIQWFSMDNQLISTKMLLFCPSLLPDLKCAQLCHFNSPPTVAAALTQDLWPDLQGTQPSPPHLSPLFQG